MVVLVVVMPRLASVTTDVDGSQFHRYHRWPGRQPVARRRTSARGQRRGGEPGAVLFRDRAVVPSRSGLRKRLSASCGSLCR
jgi:hypothetical protein